MYEKLELSCLPKTWLIDIDGTILKHNGYLGEGDAILPHVQNFFDSIPKNDYIILLTARKKDVLDGTKAFLLKNGIKFNLILTDIPIGERILINDIKPGGLKTAIAVNLKRDCGPDFSFEFDRKL
jgi:hypothetical protein